MTSDEPTTPDVRPPTIPDPLRMELAGFESDEAAKRFANILLAYLTEISRQINLTRLEAVTVAYDYEAALANVDRGIEGFARLEATATEHATGVAMTPAVLRDGVIKSHVVLDANIVRGLEQDELDRDILYILAHECGHVHDLKVRDEAFPNVLLAKKYTNIRQSTFGQIASTCWDEYAACYLSAPYSNDEMILSNLSTVFVNSSRDARIRANDIIKQYRTHADLERLIREVKHEYGDVLKFASYLLGHLHGLGKTISDCDEAHNFISGHWCGEFIVRLDASLSSLMARYGEWTDISVFEVLDNIADDLFRDGGIFISETSVDNAYVSVPFTPQTMPA